MDRKGDGSPHEGVTYPKSCLASSPGSRLEFQLFQWPSPLTCSTGTLNSTFPKLDFSFVPFPTSSPLFCLHESYHSYPSKIIVSESQTFLTPCLPTGSPNWCYFSKRVSCTSSFFPLHPLLALLRSSPAPSTWTIAMASSSTSLPEAPFPSPNALHKVILVRHPHALATQLLRNLQQIPLLTSMAAKCLNCVPHYK